MTLSTEGKYILKKKIGCSLKAYCNPSMKLAIGYGYTFDVKRGDVITNDQAEHYLNMDLERYMGRANDALQGPIDQAAFDRLVLAAFREGE